MAHTYEQFVSEAKKAGVMDRFSERDLQTAQKNPDYGISLMGLMRDSDGADTDEKRLLANEAANQLRKSYGVYTDGAGYAGSFGSKINGLQDQIANYGSFNYDNDEAYKQVLASVAEQQPFSYDVESDPSYSAYKKQYLREGDRAVANVLAQTAAATGGVPSSYAVSAAQQAGNYYAGQLADKVPELEQAAYQRYLNEQSALLNKLSALQSDREFDYTDWMNRYSMLQSSLAGYREQDATDYQRYLDGVNQKLQEEQKLLEQQRYDQQWQYQMEQDKLAQDQYLAELNRQAKLDQAESDQRAYENALDLLQLLGYATPEAAAVLGVQPGATISNGITMGGSIDLGGAGGGDGNGTETGGLDDSAGDGRTLDMESVKALGYGDLTMEQLYMLELQGKIEGYWEGNVLKYRRKGSGSGGADPQIQRPTPQVNVMQATK